MTFSPAGLFDKKNEGTVLRAQGEFFKPALNQRWYGTLVGTHTYHFDGDEKESLFFDFVGFATETSPTGQFDEEKDPAAVTWEQKDPGKPYSIKASGNFKARFDAVKGAEAGWVIGGQWLGKETYRAKDGAVRQANQWKLFGSPDHVDRDMASKIAAANASSPSPAAPAPQAAAPAPTANPFADVPAFSVDEASKVIYQMVADKFGVTDPEAAKMKAMEMTGVAWVGAGRLEQLQKIIDALQAMK